MRPPVRIFNYVTMAQMEAGENVMMAEGYRLDSWCVDQGQFYCRFVQLPPEAQSPSPIRCK